MGICLGRCETPVVPPRPWMHWWFWRSTRCAWWKLMPQLLKKYQPSCRPRCHVFFVELPVEVDNIQTKQSKQSTSSVELGEKKIQLLMKQLPVAILGLVISQAEVDSCIFGTTDRSMGKQQGWSGQSIGIHWCKMIQNTLRVQVAV